MDRKIAASFYQVSKAPHGKRDFPNILTEIIKLPQPGERERDTNPGVTLRLERCQHVGDFIHGEFCRKQTVNIPPSAGDAGLAPIAMATGHGLGHVAAFQYHIPTRIMLLQNNRQCATVNRVATYIGLFEPGAFFALNPLLRLDAYKKLNTKAIREFVVQFASPDNMRAIEREGIAAGRSAREAADVYGATAVTITISAGPERKQYLDESETMKTIKKLIGRRKEVQRLEVKSKTDDGTKWLDLIEEQFVISDEIKLPENDPDAHYQARKAWLNTAFRANEEALMGLFGP